MKQWFVSRQGKLKGPFTLPQLQDMVKTGDLKPADLVCPDGGAPMMANRVQGLFAEPAPVKPAPSPPAKVEEPVLVLAKVPPVSPKVLPVTQEATPVTQKAPRSAERPAKPKQAARPSVTGSPWALPKPVLFALCGALGGFVFAILVGELAWYLSRPNVVQSDVNLRIALPDSMKVYAGGKNQFKVKIAREGFRGPIHLKAGDAPDGLEMKLTTIADTADEADLEIKTDPAIATGSYRLGIIAEAPAQARASSVQSNVNVDVLPLPKRLGVTVSPKVVVQQGGKNLFKVRVARAGFKDSVQLSFAGLPTGVFVPNAEVSSRQDEIEMQLNAQTNATLGSGVVSLVAEGPNGEPRTSATFQVDVKPAPQPMVDVIFVVDVSASMNWAIYGVRDGIGKFVQELRDKNIDYRVGVVLFNNHHDKISFEGKWAWELRFNGQVFTTDVAVVQAEMARWQSRGGGPNEGSYDGLHEACKQDFRRVASRVLLLITDEPPLDPEVFPFDLGRPKILVKRPYPADFHMKSKQQMIDRLKEARIDQLHLVVRAKDHQYFKPLQAGARLSQGDKYVDLERFVRDPSSGAGFAAILPELSREIATLAIGSAPPAPTVDTELPILPTESGAAIPPVPAVPVLASVASTQAFDVQDRYRLVVAFALWSAIAAAGISLLISLGQQIYLRRGWLQVADWIKALAGGTLAGLVGGAIGQLLSPSAAGGAWEVLSKIFGWGLLGSLVGLGMALVVPNLKWQRGLLGGLIGGILGAMSFLIISFATQGLFGSLGDGFGRIAGATMLGFCIGLMVALAELAFRQRWLEITFGAREIRTVTLGTSVVTIGGDDRRVSVFVSGAAPIALRYRVEKDAVFCEDVSSGVTREVQPGSTQELGSVKIAVCTSSTARMSGYTLELANGTSIPLGVGMPLTANDVPGLEPQGSDGMVSLISAKPNDATKLLLRNRSKQTWKATDENGTASVVEPGRGIELADFLKIDFGPVQGTIVHD